MSVPDHVEFSAPVVVVGRPRSGTRLVARILRESGVFMGSDLILPQLDSFGWYQRFVVPLITSRFFPGLDQHADSPAFARFCEERLIDALATFCGSAAMPGTWGWKYGETLFVMPAVRRLFPRARFIHVIRDARDVCLSKGGYFQLTGPLGDPPGWGPPPLGDASPWAHLDQRPSYRDFCLATTCIGGAPQWPGVDVHDRVNLVANRFVVQVHSWLACVSSACHYGADLGTDYHELRYEDLCASPVAVARVLLDRLGLRLSDSAEAFLTQDVTVSRCRKWETARFSAREARDFQAAVRLARPLLRELGYEA
jgi:Sulfotransferase family